MPGMAGVVKVKILKQPNCAAQPKIMWHSQQDMFLSQKWRASSSGHWPGLTVPVKIWLKQHRWLCMPKSG